jgi:hypothetical protein
MSDTARDYQTIELASTEGLDAIFDSAHVPTDANPSPEPVPVDLAAKLLGSSVNALKKQLRKGNVIGHKLDTKHGSKWFVEPSEVSRLALTDANLCQAPVVTTCAGIESAPVPTDANLCQAPVTTCASIESAPVPTDANLCQAPVTTCASIESAPVPTDANLCQVPVTTCSVIQSEPVPTSVETDEHLNYIQELQLKLEGATYRIGYLEAQLENERAQIKLLTDSQHKGGWWAKFSSWFFKGK